jgi:hypothetical protein
MENKTLLWVFGAIGLYMFFSSGSEKKLAPPSQTYPPALVYPSSGSAHHECTDDCSGHQAGYDWADAHGISDPDDCDGNSQSFIEGCQEYAEENLVESGE